MELEPWLFSRRQEGPEKLRTWPKFWNSFYIWGRQKPRGFRRNRFYLPVSIPLVVTTSVHVSLLLPFWVTPKFSEIARFTLPTAPSPSSRPTLHHCTLLPFRFALLIAPLCVILTTPVPQSESLDLLFDFHLMGSFLICWLLLTTVPI